MRYLKFIIKNYKGISKEIEIDLSKKSLIPIIGVNECGKTSILNAICAFDSFNDDINHNVKHLNDVKNLYKIDNSPAEITAVISITKDEFKNVISTYYDGLDENELKGRRKNIPVPASFHGKIIISRYIENAENAKYSLLEPKINLTPIEHNALCTAIVSHLPYILYFDDFRESFPEEITIHNDEETGEPDYWLDYIERLFEKTNENYSIYDLHNLELRQRKSILSDVSKNLNQRLIHGWKSFKLDDGQPLSIAISYEKNNPPLSTSSTNNLGHLKFEIIEKDADGNERYFYIRDRSKGFYWFFNFVMKLEFNHKIIESDCEAIYLLDEPGSYLHPYAQTRLCKKLKELSESNKVIFCTHSHYLLNPDIIPLNTIHISSKSDVPGIQLTPYYSFKSDDKTIESSFQTIYDALQLRPFLLDFTNNKVLIVEGIYDYYSFSLFKELTTYDFLPGKNAHSLIDLISLMIGFRIEYKVLWDNDSEGIHAMKKATDFFGEEQSKGRFYTLETKNTKGKRILQDLFAGEDISLIRSELALETGVSFEKTIAALFFSPKKEIIVRKFSIKTRNNFKDIFNALKIYS